MSDFFLAELPTDRPTVLGPIQQEFGFAGDQSANIQVAFSTGLTVGAFFWGLSVDIIGRWWAFNLTCLFAAVFGLGLGGANTYNGFLVVTAFVGFGIGGSKTQHTCKAYLNADNRQISPSTPRSV